MTLPAGLLASVMGGGNLAALVSIPCGVCVAGGNPEPRQAVSLVGGTLVCGDYHAAVAAQACGLRGGERVERRPASEDLLNAPAVAP